MKNSTFIASALALACSASCATPRSAEQYHHVEMGEKPWAPLLEICEVSANTAICPANALSLALQRCVWLYYQLGKCGEAVNECKKTSEIDQEISAAELRAAEDRAKSLSSQRWWFAVGGAGAGVAGTILLILLAR